MIEPTTLMRSAEVQVPTRAHVVQNTPRGQTGLALWTRIAATLIEQQVLPRLMDAFIAALDRELARPRMVCQESAPGSKEQGRRLRHRRRGDHSG
jgi:hypothetical protein